MSAKWSYLISGILIASSAWTQEPSTMPPLNEMGKNISINVQETDMLTVLKILSEQSGRNVVIAPDVSATKLNLDLKDVPLSDALDVILKPHGYGYRDVGTVTVVDKLDNLKLVASVEPLESRVFKLKYLDAADVLDSAAGLLSERGSCKALYVAKKQGWEFQDSASESGSSKLERTSSSTSDARTASKTLIVSDTPSMLTRFEKILEQIDVLPEQIEIRAYFVEMQSSDITDVGFDWQLSITGNDVQTGSLSSDGSIASDTAGTIMGSTTPYGWPDSSITSMSAVESYNSGLAFGLAGTAGDVGIDAMLRAVEENGTINILSAPRIMTQDNQEASIVVGKKTPIISTSSDGDSGTISTELDYFERIGIQLNVVPQLCGNGMINMIVHPSVTEQSDSISATLVSDVDTALTAYPVIETREAETRLTVRDGQVVAIGGLIKDKDVVSESKVPLLGDIPYLGRLFRRDTTSTQKTELVILLSASVYTDNHAVQADHLDTRTVQSTDQLISTWKAKEPVDESAPADIIE
jgi:type IV pilus assembly protein PilQ